jgi:hypothetical protein
MASEAAALPPLAPLASITSQQSPVMPKLRDEIVLRYPGMDAMAVDDSVLVGQVVKDLNKDWVNGTTVGFSVEGGSRYDLHIKEVNSGWGVRASTQFASGVAQGGGSTPWLLFESSAHSSRSDAAPFRRIEVFTLVLAVSCMILAILLHAVSQHLHDIDMRAARAAGFDVERQGFGCGGLRREDDNAEGTGRWGDPDEESTGTTGGTTGSMMMDSDGFDAAVGGRRGGGATEDSNLSVMAAKHKERLAQKAMRDAKRELRESEMRLKLELARHDIGQVVYDLIERESRSSAEDDDDLYARGGEGKSADHNGGGGAESRKAFSKAEAKRRGLGYVLDGNARMSLGLVLHYERTRQWRRLFAYRFVQDPCYDWMMQAAVYVHCFVAFIEAPSPVILVTEGASAAAEERASLALAITGICIFLHVVDAVLMCLGEGVITVDPINQSARHRRAREQRVGGGRKTVSSATLRRGSTNAGGSGNMSRPINRHVALWCFLTACFVVDWFFQVTTRYNTSRASTLVSGPGGVASGTRLEFWILFPVMAVFRAFLLPLRSKRMRAAAKNFIRTIVEARFVFILLIAIIVFATITGVLLLSRRYGTQAS